MIKLGEYNLLNANRVTPQGVYLADEDGNEVLLPKKYIPADLRVKDDITVFIYNDSEDRLIATTQDPKITVGHFAHLSVKDVTTFGAFLDWGLEKDLLVPYKEQPDKLIKGNSYIVYLYVDRQTNRLVASAKINRFLEKQEIDLEEGQEVNLLVVEQNEFGLNVIINERYSGLIFENDLFAKLSPGEKTIGFIKNIRPDNKIDVILQKPGYEGIKPGVQKILDILKQNNGFMDVTDKSSPEQITRLFEMSKKTFKKSIGLLYKKKIITIKDDGIYLVE